jgi:hypothetical protein
LKEIENENLRMNEAMKAEIQKQMEAFDNEIK